ncbi:MAG: class I SAM-dependent methyltransferase [bacterium]
MVTVHPGESIGEVATLKVFFYMANFIPWKDYFFYCLDKLVEDFNLASPFLDVGCGSGELSSYLASKGWYGKAIDISDIAITNAKRNLLPFQQIVIEKKNLFEEDGVYNTIFVWDVIEHIHNDEIFLAKIVSLLPPHGYVSFSVPNNLNEWRWDDDYYGHIRRYTTDELQQKLFDAGLKPLILWDVSYPFFWVMRRLYTRLKSPPEYIDSEKSIRTENSTATNAWDIPVISNLLNRRHSLWRILYYIQFRYFRKKTESGNELFVLAEKIE